MSKRMKGGILFYAGNLQCIFKDFLGGSGSQLAASLAGKNKIKSPFSGPIGKRQKKSVLCI